MECTRMPESEACSAYLRTVSHQALIVFDLDGTIADSRELARESYKRVFALMGFGQITDELADSFNGPDADEVCRVMGIGKDRRALYDELVDQTDVELTRSMGLHVFGHEPPCQQLVGLRDDGYFDQRQSALLRSLH